MYSSRQHSRRPQANRDFAECLVEYEPGIEEEIKTLLFDHKPLAAC